MKKLWIIGVILLGLAWFLFAPSRIDPVAWTPPVDGGLVGDFAENDLLQKAEIVPVTLSFGPEDVAVDAEGRIYGGLHDGQIIRMNADGSDEEVFAFIEGGRPLGLHFDASGNLIVADSWKGLLSIAPNGTITTLTTGHDGRPFAFTDDLDIAADGKIYFSDASDTYGQPDYRLDLIEGRPHGRLMVYDPATRETDMLLDDLYFANGVALSVDEDFVLVNETARYRVTRYWLKGEKAGTSDVFIDNLPGFPDGISGNGAGLFWLAIPSPRNPTIDGMHDNPFLKNIVAKLPVWLQPAAIQRGFVIALDEEGRVVKTLQDPAGERVYMVTSAEQVGDTLYLGSLEAPQVARVKVE